MGNPYTSPGIQRVRTPTVARGLDILDKYQMDQIDTLQRHCEEAVSVNPGIVAGSVCSEIPSYISDVSGKILVYDTRIFEYDWDPIE
mmetsp:Transcript_48937/g.36022  ORF Transcript_48937/g.36022 Transcript_48937/m.36022 type:complete len:87 (+) Transcript_48937:741-1001(+)